jgi:hypothetical protein
MATTETEQRKPTSKEAWAKRATHVVACPSGEFVKVRIPNIADMVVGDAIPDRLMQAALRELVDPGSIPLVEPAEGEAETNGGAPRRPEYDLDLIKKMAEFMQVVLLRTIVEPEVKDASELSLFPQEDLDFLIQIARRERYTDWQGRVLGVARIDQFRDFAEKHGCPPDCEACEAHRRELSTTGPGVV